MKEKEEKKFLKSIQLALRAGIIVSFSLFAAGMITGIAILLSVGIIALIFTPVLRIIMLGIGFYRMREHVFALASFGVLVLMLISLLV
ncbi:MAG: hypothetical protein Fur0012_13020 [Elusimicrobiota bacterium]